MAVKNALIFTSLFLLLVNTSARPQETYGEDGDMPIESFEDLEELLAARSPHVKENENDLNHEKEKEWNQFSTPPVPKEIENWPTEPLDVGQITAVSINSKGQPVIFHRADRVWDESSFNESHSYQHYSEGPIKKDTVLVLDCHTGAVVTSWGADSFYMPHGLTVDRHDNVWVTDVAMHQVFKYTPGHRYPRLTLGEAFRGGSPRGSRVLLCMPTAVAIATTGEVFVADGYCNNQILKFNAAGGLLRMMPSPPEFLSLQVPHGLALLEHLDLVCVADRENMRVVCPRAGLMGSASPLKPPANIQAPDLGRVFAIAALGDLVYVVNGPTSPMIKVRGFTIDPQSEEFLGDWGPKKGFTNPHSIAIARNGSYMFVTEIGPNKIWKFDLVAENQY